MRRAARRMLVLMLSLGGALHSVAAERPGHLPKPPQAPWEIEKTLRSFSPQQLQTKALSSSDSLPFRWAAVQELARRRKMGPPDFFIQLLSHPDWFMRNAGLVGLSQLFDRKPLLQAALKLLKDPALVVRSAAVDQLTVLKETSSWPHLLEALSSKQNFHRGQSLWIRPQIAQLLGELAQPGQERFLLSLIEDSDSLVSAALISGLERMTQLKFGSPQEAETLKKWVAWGKSQEPSLL